MIHRIERSNGLIRVEASDNVMVVKVRVVVLDQAGKVLEEGHVLQIDERGWEFVSDAKGKVMAEAWDLAGNVTTRDESQ